MNSGSEMLRYLDKHGVVDKDCLSVRGARSRRPRGASQAVLPAIDLHGLTEERAAQALRARILACRDNGARTLLVIHGHGMHSAPGDGPVLKNLVRRMLDNELRGLIRDYRTAPPRQGGDGATVILLR